MFQRLKAVREAAGVTQLQFLARLNAAAESLGKRTYAQSQLSRLENGLQEPTFDDVAVFALVDPERRGKLWLAWGETTDSAQLPKAGPSVIKEPPAEIFDQPPLGTGRKTARGRKPA